MNQSLELLANPTTRPRRRRKGLNENHTLALDCAKQLMGLQETFPQFRSEIENAIRRVRRQGRRTEESDREAVLAALAGFERAEVPATDEEIADEIDIPLADVRAVLEFLTSAAIDLVIMEEKGGKTDVARGARQLYYFINPRPQPRVAQTQQLRAA